MPMADGGSFEVSGDMAVILDPSLIVGDWTR